jgi:hypothetical protein
MTANGIPFGRPQWDSTLKMAQKDKKSGRDSIAATQ